MRHLMLVTLIATLLTGCAASPASRLGVDRLAAQPVVRVIPGYKGPAPTVTVTATSGSTSAVAVAREAADTLLAADMNLDAIELLIQDGGAYMVAGWFTDLKDTIKRTWTRWKLSREVKAALKHNRDKAFELHEGEIDSIRKNRTAPKTTINDLGDGLKEIVSTWKSTNQGNFEIETRRAVDDEGVTQNLSVSLVGKNKKGLAVELERVRSLTGSDGSYRVATTQSTTYKDGRQERQEWLKVVSPNGYETITGFIDHRDGNRTEISGSRDLRGKVRMAVNKIAPTPAD